MALTQKDIARRLGVSPSLVSRALCGTAANIGAAERTVQRIREEAVRLGYGCNAAALTLRGEPTRTLGIVVKDFEDPYFGLLVGELQRVAAAAGYSLVLTGCDTGRLDAGALTKYLVDGLVIIGSEFEPQGLAPFFASATPVVQIGSGPTRPGLARVCMQQAAGLGELLDYLASLGHTEIGYLGDGSPAAARRKGALQQEMRRRGANVRRQWFVDAPRGGPQAGREAVERLFAGRGGELPTALVAADDVLAQGAMRALFERGSRVPHDMSLAGVDDIPSACMTIPALTTIRQPMAAMVQEAFRLVTGAWKRGQSPFVRSTLRAVPANGDCPLFHGCLVEVPPELVVRESCAAPRGTRSIRMRVDGEREIPPRERVHETA